MPFIFPDPSVQAEVTAPNGEVWRYIDGAWTVIAAINDDQEDIEALEVSDAKQDVEIAALKSGETIDRTALINLSNRVASNETAIESVQSLELTNALSALALAQQDIIDLKSKVNTLELTSFLIME
jgi:hypothetical protein